MFRATRSTRGGGRPGTPRPPIDCAGLAIVVLAALALASACGSARAADPGATAADASVPGARKEPAIPDVLDVLARYNDTIDAAFSRIESLRVEQEMIEPQDDGSFKCARAVLRYTPDGGMVREELSSELRYPPGDFTLASLVGPRIDPAEYEVAIEGVEDAEGHECYRLALVALERDVEHFDGTVWLSIEHLAPVLIQGEVADPPFPVSEIKIDKSFLPGPGGHWLLRRHTGEVAVNLLLVRKRGLRHIFYDRYVVNGEAATPAEDAP